MANFDLEITINDSATAFFKYMADTKPEWMRKSMKSAGWWMQKEIKKGIRSGAPGGVRYKPFMPSGMRSNLEKTFGNGGKKTYAPLGKLSNAVGYQYKPEESAVVVGWLSRSAVKLGEKIESGFERIITQKMRNYFFVAGVPLSQKSSMIVAARKTYEPMRNMLEPKTSIYVEDKLYDYMNQAPQKQGTSSRRRYRVY